jgi:4-amino-4-deoxy-L-arabinose transferase-like glycosyltransferase
MNIVYSPIHTALAAGILLIIPVVFHLVAFRKSIRFIHILSSILIGNFILAFVAEIAGLAHFFDAKIILILSLLVAGIVGYWVNKKNIFDNENIIGNNVSKASIFLVIGIAIFLFLYQKNFFPPFTPDTVHAYLPWARIIVNEGSIPAFHFETNSYHTIHIPPLLYLNIAFLFSLFHEYIDSIPAAIPILYSVFFVFLITNWGEEHTDRTIPFFTVLALLFSLSMYFTYYSTVVLQEAPILFFTTASFYLLFKYLRTKENLFLVLLAISSSLGALTKHSGLVISVMLFCILIIKVKEKKELYNLLTIYPLIHIPSILWTIRSFYFYNNPVYPMLGRFFESSLKTTSGVLSGTCGYITVSPQDTAIGFLFAFPAFLFALVYMIRNWKKIEVQCTVACFAVFLVFLSICGSRLLVRYLYPFLGIFALFAGIEMSRLYDLIPSKTLKKKKGLIITAIVIALCITLLLLIPTNFTANIKTGNYKSIVTNMTLTSFDPREANNVLEDEMGIVEYLQKNEKEKNLVIFTDYDHVNTWYGNYTSLSPGSISFLLLNHKVNKEPFDVTKNSTYIYNSFKKIGINYVYDSPKWKRGKIEMLFETINQDPEHFELVYDKNGYRLWKIK